MGSRDQHETAFLEATGTDEDDCGVMKSGEGGIRTPGTGEGTLVFKTSAIGHSATSPEHLKTKLFASPLFPPFSCLTPDRLNCRMMTPAVEISE